MKNVLNYYYRLNINKLTKVKKQYIFYDQEYKYVFQPFLRPLEEALPLYHLNQELLKINPIYQRIILNSNHQILTFHNKRPYILLQSHLFKDEKIFLNNLHYNNRLPQEVIKKITNLTRFNWVNLWEQKIDYFEYQKEHFQKKYSFLTDTLTYYIGMGENAISYIQDTFIEEKNAVITLVVSHRRVSVNDTLVDYYNPMNLIIDHKTRDIAEYLKSSFFYDSYRLEEIEEFLKKENMSRFDFRLLYGRLLFPTFYFDLYEKVINDHFPEQKIISITNRILEYERFLYDIFIIIEKYTKIPPVAWLIKKFSD